MSIGVPTKLAKCLLVEISQNHELSCGLRLPLYKAAMIYDKIVPYIIISR